MTTHNYASLPMEGVAGRLNQVLRGWGAYFRHGNSSDKFATIDSYVNQRLAQLASGRLADHERRYRELAAQLAEIGLISAPSITRRYTVYGTSGCRCHADPPQRHGPYYQWTAKENGDCHPAEPLNLDWLLYRRQWMP